MLVVFTDGMAEAENEEGEEFGENRLMEGIRIGPGPSASETLRQLMADVDRFVGTARQHDDVTCLVLRAV